MKIEYLWYIICIYKLLKLTLGDSSCTPGFDKRTRVLDLREKCEFNFHYLSQEETNVVTIYDAYKKDLPFHRCEIGFRGFNPSNVFTTWNVCFYPTKYTLLSCNVTLSFFSGFKKFKKTPKINYGQQPEDYNSWCTDDQYGYMLVEIKDPKPCNRMLTLEVEVCASAGVSMTIGSCAALVAGVAVVIVVFTVCCVRYQRKKNFMDSRTENTVEQQARPQSQDNLHNNLVPGHNGQRSSNRQQGMGHLLSQGQRSPQLHHNSTHRDRSPHRHQPDSNTGLPPPSYEECMLSSTPREEDVLPSYDSVKSVETNC